MPDSDTTHNVICSKQNQSLQHVQMRTSNTRTTVGLAIFPTCFESARSVVQWCIQSYLTRWPSLIRFFVLPRSGRWEASHRNNIRTSKPSPAECWNRMQSYPVLVTLSERPAIETRSGPDFKEWIGFCKNFWDPIVWRRTSGPFQTYFVGLAWRPVLYQSASMRRVRTVPMLRKVYTLAAPRAPSQCGRVSFMFDITNNESSYTN